MHCAMDELGNHLKMFDPSTKKGFEQIGRVSRRAGKAGSRLLDRLFGYWLGNMHQERSNWVSDADWARIQQQPVKARMLVYAITVTIIVLGIWAGFAEVDEITRGEGRVIPASQLQVIQSVDGGVVKEILVREGQVVEAGEVLMRVDPTRFISTLRENHARYLALLTKAARLEALTMGAEFVAPDEVVTEAPGILDHERKLYFALQQELEAQLSIAREQLEQRQQELNEVRARLVQATRSYELGSRELALTRPLLGSGAISEVEVIRLEREVSRALGDRDQAMAQISRINSAIQEAERRLEEIKLAFNNRLRNELSATLSELATLTEGSVGLRDRVMHAEIRAPVKGTIQRLIVTTQGAVVQPGREVMELVPMDDQLMVEAKVSPRDIAFLHPGQAAVVKLTAYDFAIYGGLEAVVEHISADAITDERGNSYYLVRVRTESVGFGDDLPVIPGMMAQVDIMTGKKTLLEYMLKPILRAKSYALTER